jgi:DNA-binding transcriptional MocR family regulator
VSSAIRDGELAEGDRLPPIRDVATALGVSPTTVSAAWSLLARAGTIRTDGRRGTTIAPRTAIGPTRYRRALVRQTAFPLDLSTGVPDPELLPDLAAALHRMKGTSAPGNYLDDAVLPGLIEVLRVDWPYQPERMTIADGAMDALDLLCRTLLRYGDKVLVEHPSFPPLLDLLESVGVQPVGVSIDESGPTVEGLSAVLHSSAASAVAFFLQPRAQNPTGVSLSRARAQELAELLAPTGVVVVEDDSAGAIATSEAISLGSWLPSQTVHIRSFSKSHGPDLRLAAISGSAQHLDALAERRFLGQGWTSRLLQALLLDLLTQARSIKQVEQARRVYSDRRQRVVAALADRGVQVPGQDGLNIWLPVRDEAAALVRLASRGIGAAAGSPFAIRPDGGPHLRVTTGLLTRDFDRVAGELADASGVGAWASPR